MMSPLPDELQKAKDFHSHLGPYLVVGLKMGRAIVGRLGHKPFSMGITIFTGPKPPLSCVVDGLQLSTPCTVGNGGILIREGGQVRVLAELGQRRLEVSLRPSIQREIAGAEGGQRLEEIALRLWTLPESQLLDLHEEG
jgi:formylmethanofuran dehydrogenase subunit E